MTTKVLNISSITNKYISMNQQQRQSIVDRHQNIFNLLNEHSQIREASIKFMMKACSKYRFRKDTLFLAVKILDILIQKRYMGIHSEYQLISASLILLCTKYNQVYPVNIDQLGLITDKYYQRSLIVKVQGQILECIDFQIPQQTVFSHLYNELLQIECNSDEQKTTDSDKQNDSLLNKANQQNMNKKQSYSFDQKKIVEKTIKAIRQPECLKYGQVFLFNALLSYFKNTKTKGILSNSSVSVVKTNYVKSILQRLFEPIQKFESNINLKSIGLPPKSPKLNPQMKNERKLKFLIF